MMREFNLSLNGRGPTDEEAAQFGEAIRDAMMAEANALIEACRESADNLEPGGSVLLTARPVMGFVRKNVEGTIYMRFGTPVPIAAYTEDPELPAPDSFGGPAGDPSTQAV